jgi:antitoxin component of RelBE/YafQ-DinJ toxin-antitoxin module
MQTHIIFLLTSPLFYVSLLIILGSIAGFIGFGLGLSALIQVKALKESTHSVQYMPIDPSIDDENQKTLNSWATSDGAINEQHQMFKEDLEDDLPEFAPKDEDKKKHSY